MLMLMFMLKPHLLHAQATLITCKTQFTPLSGLMHFWPHMSKTCAHPLGTSLRVWHNLCHHAMFRVLANFPVCASVHAPMCKTWWWFLLSEKSDTAFENENPSNPLQGWIQEHAHPHLDADRVKGVQQCKSSWKFHVQRESELKSRVSKACWCFVCQKMHQVQNWKNAQMQKSTKCKIEKMQKCKQTKSAQSAKLKKCKNAKKAARAKLKIHSNEKCAAMLESDFSEHLHLTYFLTDSCCDCTKSRVREVLLQPAPNQGSMKPCFNLPWTRRKCMLGERMPSPSCASLAPLGDKCTECKSSCIQKSLPRDVVILLGSKVPWDLSIPVCGVNCSWTKKILLYMPTMSMTMGAQMHQVTKPRVRGTEKSLCIERLQTTMCARANSCHSASNSEALQNVHGELWNFEHMHTCMSMLLHLRNCEIENAFLCSSPDVTKGTDKQTLSEIEFCFVLFDLWRDPTRCDKTPELMWKSWCDEVTTPRRWSGWRASHWKSSRPRSSPSSCSTSSSCNHGT